MLGDPESPIESRGSPGILATSPFSSSVSSLGFGDHRELSDVRRDIFWAGGPRLVWWTERGKKQQK